MTMKLPKKYIIIGTLLGSLACLFFFQSPVHAEISGPTPDSDPIRILSPEPRIEVPGLEFTDIDTLQTNVQNDTSGAETRRYIHSPFLAEYIRAVYQYAVAAASVLAIIMIIVAGLQWTISGGNTERITAAKKRISNALVGLSLAVGSFTILYTINPELVEFRSIKVFYIETKDVKYGFGREVQSGLASGNIKTRAEAVGIHCPGSGGADEINRIVESMVDKVAYRMDGKAWASDRTYDYDKEEYKTCPRGNMCLDCSGFVSFVYECAGLNKIPGGTANLFAPGAKGVETIKEKEVNGKKVPDINFQTNGVNGKPLQIGDMLGWQEGWKNHAAGHVIMYIGNGRVVHSTGKSKARGANPFFQNLSTFTAVNGFHLNKISRIEGNQK